MTAEPLGTYSGPAEPPELAALIESGAILADPAPEAVDELPVLDWRDVVDPAELAAMSPAQVRAADQHWWARLSPAERLEAARRAHTWREGLAASLARAGAESEADYLARIAGPALRVVPGDRAGSEDRAAAMRPALAPVAELSAPADLDRWLVEGVNRPRTVTIVASGEGVGKSQVRHELEIRCAAGVGPLFGHYAIPRPLVVATFDEENGEAEEWRRDEQILATLGLERAALTGRLYRASFAGIDLTDASDQAFVRAELERVGADVVHLDTGTMMLAEEWGGPIKTVMRFLHSLPCSAFVYVHLTKPERQRRGAGPAPAHGTQLTDVMGQWTRSADAVALMSDLGAGRIRWAMRKRVPPSSLVLAPADGIFRVVAADAGEPAGPSLDDRILRALAAGASSADEIRTALGVDGRPVPERSFYKALGRLRQGGWVAPGTPLELTDEGREAVE